MENDFFLTFSSLEANFKENFSGIYFLPSEIILDNGYEIALDAFYSSYTFPNTPFITINCDLFPKSYINNQATNSCQIIYNQNINEQIFKNHYFKLQKTVIDSINISIQNLKFQNITFDTKELCVFKFHFRKR